MKQAFVIVDLDGTFVSCNSFHLWIRFIWKKSFSTLPFIATIELNFFLLKLFLLRKCSILDHSNFKKEIQILWSKFFSDYKKKLLLEKFNDELDQFVSKNIHDELLALSNRSNKIILATAAPSEYAKPFSSRYSFFHSCLSTPSANDLTWFDNIRKKKKDCVTQTFSSDIKNSDEIILFTDHSDDLPLIYICETVYLFHPLCEEINDLRRQYTKKKFIQLI